MPEPQVQIRFRLSEYLKAGSHKTAISLPELVEQTNSFSTKNRPGCVPKLDGSRPKDLFLEYNVKCNLKTSDPHGHDVRVRFDTSEIEGGALAKDLDIYASCSCPAFLYWGAQWNMHQRDALEGEARPLLTAPTERLDLRGHFVICKHCKAVFERILPSVQHNIVKILREKDMKRRKEKRELPPVPVEPKSSPEENPPPAPIESEPEVVAPERETGPLDNVVKRDTPATPEEKQRVPVLDEQTIPEPSTAQPQVTEPQAVEPEVVEPAQKNPPPAPQRPKLLQRNPQFPPQTPQQRQQDKLRMREDRKRQQRQYEQRLRNNPGYRG